MLAMFCAQAQEDPAAVLELSNGEVREFSKFSVRSFSSWKQKTTFDSRIYILFITHKIKKTEKYITYERKLTIEIVCNGVRRSKLLGPDPNY